MTGRERMEAVLHKQPRDRFNWTTLVDEATLAQVPPTARGEGPLDFYRYLGCDILLLNGWNTPHVFASPRLDWGSGVRTEVRQEGGRVEVKHHTLIGTLSSVTVGGHPCKYLVETEEDLRLYRHMWEEAVFTGHEERQVFEQLESLISYDGVMTRFWGPSVVPRLLENDMGTENFYFAQADFGDELAGLMETMHEKELEAFRILAGGPWSSVTLVENTSTFYISPALYRDWNMPHQRDFVEIVKAAGKTAILHMCGHVRTLLPLIKETGCDGIHALTPPPTGDCPWEDALDVLGEDTIIFGCLDPSVWVTGSTTEIPSALDKAVSQRLREGNFVLCPFADGIAVPLERFQAVGEWVARHP